MEDQQNSIDEIFRQSLGDYREAPPAAAWDDVASKLDAGSLLPAKKYFLHWKWISLLLLLVAGGIWFINANSGKQKALTIATVKKDIVKPTTLVLPKESAGRDTQNITIAATGEAGSNTVGNMPEGKSHSRSNAQNVSGESSTENNEHRSSNQSLYRTAHRNAIKNKHSHTPQRNESDSVNENNNSIVASTKQSKRSPAKHTNKRRQEVVANTHYTQQSVASTREDALHADKNPAKKTGNAADKAADNKPAKGTSNTLQKITPVNTATSIEGGKPHENNRRAERQPAVATKDKKTNPSSSNTSLEQPVASGKGASKTENVLANRLPKTTNRRTQHNTASNEPIKTKQDTLVTTDKATKAKDFTENNSSELKHHATKTEHAAGNNNQSVAEQTKYSPSPKSGEETALIKQPDALKPFSGKPLDDIADNNKTVQNNSTPSLKEKKNTQPAVIDKIPAQSHKASKPATQNVPDRKPTPPVANNNSNPKTAPPIVNSKENKTGDTGEKKDKPETDATQGNTGSGAQGTQPTSKHKKGLNLSFPASLDVFAGYEWAFQKPAPNKGIVGLQFSWYLNAEISIGIMPAYRFGNVTSLSLADGGTFGNVTPVHVDSSLRTVTDTLGAVTKFYTYKPSQQYDSIRTPQLNAGGKYWEFELPLILSYQAGNWRFYGGPSVNFGGKINLTSSGNIQTYAKVRTDSITLTNVQLPSDTFRNFFGVNLTPYSNYSPTQSEVPTMRIGYLAGIGYQYGGFLMDASLHQQLTGYNRVAPALQKVYSSPNFRISLGYRLFGPRPAQLRAAREKYFLQRL